MSREAEYGFEAPPKEVTEIVDAVSRFGKIMIGKMLLPKNVDKPHWRHVENSGYFIQRISEELQELQVALTGTDVEAIESECADIANFAMMIADNARRVHGGQEG